MNSYTVCGNQSRTKQMNFKRWKRLQKSSICNWKTSRISCRKGTKRSSIKKKNLWKGKEGCWKGKEKFRKKKGSWKSRKMSLYRKVKIFIKSWRYWMNSWKERQVIVLYFKTRCSRSMILLAIIAKMRNSKSR